MRIGKGLVAAIFGLALFAGAQGVAQAAPTTVAPLAESMYAPASTGPAGFDFYANYGDWTGCVNQGNSGESRGLWRDYVCVSNSATSYDLWVLWNA